MALIRWGEHNDWFSEVNRMQREMERLLSAFSPRTTPSRWPSYRTQVYPPLNIYDDGESMIVRAEVPGVDPKTLNVEVTGDTLTLRGERKVPEVSEGASYHRRERDFGQFRRSFTLPDKIDNHKVHATCQDGVLEVRLPHAEETKARKVSVTSR